MSARRSRGFSLVELMMAVAIVGILASVALPSFRNLQLRTRQSERNVVTRIVKQSVEDFYVRYGRLEDGRGNPLPLMTGPANPPGAPGPSRRAYDPRVPNWSLLGVTEQFLEGALYYSYSFIVLDGAGHGNRTLYVQADGDLDGDADPSTRWYWYTRNEQHYVLASTWPAEGQPDQSQASGRLTW